MRRFVVICGAFFIMSVRMRSRIYGDLGKSVLILIICHFVLSARIDILAHGFNFKRVELGNPFRKSFLNERIDQAVALSISDSALAGLGVNTTGDRIRLRELCTTCTCG